MKRGWEGSRQEAEETGRGKGEAQNAFQARLGNLYLILKSCRAPEGFIMRSELETLLWVLKGEQIVRKKRGKGFH